MWTIVNNSGMAMANCDFEPDHADLLTRGERAYYHAEHIALSEAQLIGGAVRRKPLITLTAEVADSVAVVNVACEDNRISTIPLLIAGTPVTKPLGAFVIQGEHGVKLWIDFDRAGLRGSGLEVSF